MNEPRPDFSDPEFLASQDLDQTLPPSYRAVLDAACAESDDLRAFAADLKRVQDWLDVWRAEDETLDYSSFVRIVHARMAISPKEEAELGTVDAWLERWASQPPELGSDRFVADVMQRIAPTHRRRFTSARWFRVGVPLAAAAAIVFAVIVPFPSDSGGSGQCIVEFAKTVQAPSDRDNDVVVAFARDVSGVPISSDTEPRVSFVSFGSSVVVTDEPPPPL